MGNSAIVKHAQIAGTQHRLARNIKNSATVTQFDNDVPDTRSVLLIASAEVDPESVALQVLRNWVRGVGAGPVEFTRWLKNSAKLSPDPLVQGLPPSLSRDPSITDSAPRRTRVSNHSWTLTPCALAASMAIFRASEVTPSSRP